jgi:hypothetical protein
MRKEDIFKQLSVEDKWAQDLAFLHHMSETGNKLRKNSFFFYLFPRDVQVVMERLFTGKPLEWDVGGLLGLIMIAGLGFDEEAYFHYVITMLYRTETPSPLFMGTQNLGVMLFGVTLNDVSKTPKAETDTPVLTLFCFRSVFVLEL